MADLLDLLSYKFNQRALLAAVLIGFLNGYFSGYVVLRRTSLFAGALSHALLPGIASGILLFGMSMMAVVSGALAAALFIALGALAIEHGTRIDRDSAMAVLYTTSFAAGLLILQSLPVNVAINDILFGNILGLSDSALWLVLAVSAVILPLLIFCQRPLQLMLFQEDIAQTMGVPVSKLNPLLMVAMVVTIVTSFQAVGVILSLGLLVTPACIMQLFARSSRSLMFGSGIIGALISITAIILANVFNIQPGACIILLLGLCFMAAFTTAKIKHRAQSSAPQS